MPAVFAAEKVLEKEGRQMPPEKYIFYSFKNGPDFSRRKIRDDIEYNVETVSRRIEKYFSHPKIAALVALSKKLNSYPLPIASIMARILVRKMKNAIKEHIKTDKDWAKAVGPLVRFTDNIATYLNRHTPDNNFIADTIHDNVHRQHIENTIISTIRGNVHAEGIDITKILQEIPSSYIMKPGEKPSQYKEKVYKALKEIIEETNLPVETRKYKISENEVQLMDIVGSWIDTIKEDVERDGKKKQKILELMLEDIEANEDGIKNIDTAINIARNVMHAGIIAEADEKTAEKIIEILHKIDKKISGEGKTVFHELHKAPEIGDEEKRRVEKILDLIKSRQEENYHKATEEIDNLLKDIKKRKGKLGTKELAPLLKYVYKKIFKEPHSIQMLCLIPLSYEYHKDIRQRWEREPKKVVEDLLKLQGIYNITENILPNKEEYETLKYVLHHQVKYIKDLVGMSDLRSRLYSPDETLVVLDKEELQGLKRFVEEYIERNQK